MVRKVERGSWLAWGVAVVGLLVASSAPASTFSVLGTVPGLASARTIRFTLDQPGALPDASQNVYVVGFQSKLDGVAGTSFCVDVLHSLSLGGTYQATAESLSGPYLDAANIAHRWANDLGSMASSLGISLADAASGVQLAVWSSVYDDPNALGTISFGRALTAGEKLAFARANDSSYWTGTGGSVLIRLKDAAGSVRQAQIFTPAVPEPTGFVVFGVGSLLIARILRKRPAAPHA
ncbi:MAG TPA: hypothetical protein VMW35_16305 [Myxococcota bacterium]|jgi:hypothetical protein|nr:hypothetical protein [Myxococcota bacterium]